MLVRLELNGKLSQPMEEHQARALLQRVADKRRANRIKIVPYIPAAQRAGYSVANNAHCQYAGWSFGPTREEARSKCDALRQKYKKAMLCPTLKALGTG